MDTKLVGKNIRALRMAYGEKSYELAEAIEEDSPTSMISNYEAGTRKRIDVFEGIAKRYGVTMDTLLFHDISDIPENFIYNSPRLGDLATLCVFYCASEKDDRHYKEAVELLRNNSDLIFKEYAFSLLEKSNEACKKAKGICDDSEDVYNPKILLWFAAVQTIMAFGIKHKIALEALDDEVSPEGYRLWVSERFLPRPADEHELSEEEKEAKREIDEELSECLSDMSELLSEMVKCKLNKAAAYYKALWHLFGLVEDEKTDAEKIEAGANMLNELYVRGNPYAKVVCLAYKDAREGNYKEMSSYISSCKRENKVER